jgi:hypothetical protein
MPPKWYFMTAEWLGKYQNGGDQSHVALKPPLKNGADDADAAWAQPLFYICFG